jgi:hypothetical protein
VFSLFFRTRRRSPALRPHRARLGVEALERRDAPSSLDVTTFAAPPTDSTTSDTWVSSTALAPAPQTDTVTTTTTTTATVTPAPEPLAPAPQAGDVMPAPTTGSPTLPVILPPAVVNVVDEGDWNYAVSGTVSDPNPAALTVNVSVDGNPLGSAPVKPVLNADGTPANKGTWSMTFGLPACTSATDSTRFATAVASDGKRVSQPTAFTIEQSPVVSSTLSNP